MKVLATATLLLATITWTHSVALDRRSGHPRNGRPRAAEGSGTARKGAFNRAAVEGIPLEAKAYARRQPQSKNPSALEIFLRDDPLPGAFFRGAVEGRPDDFTLTRDGLFFEAENRKFIRDAVESRPGALVEVVSARRADGSRIKRSSYDLLKSPYAKQVEQAYLNYLVERNTAVRNSPYGTSSKIEKNSGLNASQVFPALPVTLSTVGTIDLDCLNHGDNFYRDVSSCSRYYRCIGTLRYSFQCPTHMAFDSNTQQCIEVDLVDCSLRGALDSKKKELANRAAFQRQDQDKKLVCYVTSRSWSRDGQGKFAPENIDPFMCTHIVYAFAKVDAEKLMIRPSDKFTDFSNELYIRTTALKKLNPDLKVLIGLGGWADSQTDKYSRLVTSEKETKKFAYYSTHYMSLLGFDGLFLDWQYPRCWQGDCTKGPTYDKANFARFIKTVKAIYSGYYLLAANVAPYSYIIDEAYDVPTLADSLDFVTVAAYDMHGSWESVTGHLAPLKGSSGDQRTADAAMTYWERKGMPKSKLLMGVPAYGLTFKLQSGGQARLGVKAQGPGNPGAYTKQYGMLAYYEICSSTKEGGWSTAEDNGNPIAVKDKEWVGYETPDSALRKAQYIKDNGYGGAAIWSLDLDDFDNRCCQEAFPVVKALARGLQLRRDVLKASCEKTLTPPTPEPYVINAHRCSPWEPEFCIGEALLETLKAAEKFVEDALSTSQPVPSTPATTTQKPPITTTAQSTTTQTTTTTATSTTTTTTSTSTGSTTTNTATTTTKPVTVAQQSTTTARPVEVQACSHGDYLPVPNQCGAFARCIHGKLEINFCASGLHWNNEAQLCDWPQSAGCSKNSQAGTIGISAVTQGTTKRPKPVETAPPQGSSKPCEEGQYYQADKDCSSYQICSNGRLFRVDCPSGLHFSLTKKICDWPDHAQCPWANIKKTTNIRSCTGSSFLRDPTDCGAYQICVHGLLQTFYCPPGLYWNTGSNVCDWPSNVDCDAPASTASPTQVTTSVPLQTVSTTAASTVRPVVSQSTVKPVTATPIVEGLTDDFKVVCYFTNWAWYRQPKPGYLPSDIDPQLCTHIIYAFVVLDGTNLVIRVHDPWADIDNKFFEKVTALRKKGVKVLVGLGGWNDSQGDKYSRLVHSPAARAKFIQNTLEFIDNYGFDGLDLDWEYPKCWQTDCKKGPASDKENFATWVRELREAFKPRGLLLSAAVTPSKTIVDEGYDVSAISRDLDWIAVMCYDYHGQWDKKTGHVAPFYFHSESSNAYYNANYTMNYWIRQGADPRKLVMGMPTYGQSFTLAEASVNGLNAPSYGGGDMGESTGASGFLSYYEICDRILNRGWTVVEDPEGAIGPYAYKGNQWVGFDDANMIRRKSHYVVRNNLGGAMIWALDLDDYKNNCGCESYPLLRTINRVLRNYPGPDPLCDITGNMPSPTTPGSVVIAPASTPSTTLPSSTTSVAPPASTSTVPPSTTSAVPPPTQTTTPKPVSSATPSTTVQPEVAPTPETSPVVVDGEYKVVCYFTNWAWYRPDFKYYPSNIDPDLCTHIVYGFAVLDYSELTIRLHDSWADIDNKFFEKVTNYRSKGIKVLIALGGWNDSQGDKYSRLVNNPAARAKFIKHALNFIETYNFDGLDLDWEYPKCWQVDCSKGPASDKASFSLWVKELRIAFAPKGYLLTAAVSPSKKVIDEGYDVPALSRDLSWIAVMTYDYYGNWDKKTGHVAPLYDFPGSPFGYFNTNYTINYWINQGADPKKLVMGMPMYGQSFTLANPSNNGLNAPAAAGGEAGEFTRQAGFLSYYEICYKIQNGGWTVVKDPSGALGPYAYKGNQWVGFDDVDMIRRKSELVRTMGIGGAMIWALDLDDFRNRCGCEEYPLLRTINRVLRNYPKKDPQCTLSSQPGKYTPSPIPTTVPTTSVTEGADSSCTMGQFKHHPTNCGQYYQCLYGKWNALSCPAGLHWNKDHCDWPTASGCVSTGNGTVAETTTLPASTTTTTRRPSSTTSTSSTTAQSTLRPPVGTTNPPKPPTASDTGYKVVCYFTNWARYRPDGGKYYPEDIDSDLCTHIVYGFATLHPTNLVIQTHDSWADIDLDGYGKVAAYRQKGIKVILGLGGWNDSEGDKYSRLVNNPSARANFIRHALEFIEKYGFDGLDLDWEYPKCWQVNCERGPASDKQAFVAWTKELQEAFQPKGYLLTAAVSPSKIVIDEGYDVPELTKYLDLISIMTYDYYGHWDKRTFHVAPLYFHSEADSAYFNVNYTVNYWERKGADKKKLIMGMPMYGQSFTLNNPADNGLNAPASLPGERGQFTGQGGFLAYYEICDNVKNKGWTVVQDEEGAIGPYAYKGNQWVGFDDADMIRRKSQIVKDLGIGGAMIWALDLDDFTNRCKCEPYPLLRTINRVLRNYPGPDPQCRV